MSNSVFQVLTPFAPRPVTFRGVIDCAGYQLKSYSIVCGDVALDESVYEEGMKLVERALPQPAIDRHRPGLGFVIFHQGEGVHYLVLAWWDQVNEMPLHVWVHTFEPETQWREAQGGESVCVWDLEVIAHERTCYVEEILSKADAPDFDAYRSRVFSKKTSPAAQNA